ncbi:class I SAM-dependent methyltransferase [Bradyrhizobium sp. YCK136]|uniref:class I SAM-dependent methyltransferase n=1 Tax=Bradyrhizobium TaxID=374 RepID=UPI001B8AD109|nr:class I SAM-dependent methyltransferase [Bradyrhizobium diazoefficiens]MBR0868067.1 class I SAM-dependent methyltransferase [Bradyrhizobium diazoefficiens]MBR0892104.1 class I SAM-dependent methyltransferase [Bradyrhizobium diazoefficiens]MBR0924291.1 class I SAM-dependent methyltransferase [Bradyrhizobium diazoefficiens]
MASKLVMDPKREHHYKVEIGLADRLRNSSRAERAHLYSSVYEELFREVPYHSQLVSKSQETVKRAELQKLFETLRPFLNHDTVYAEIGAGDCALTMLVAPHVRKAYAIDVSETVTRGATAPNLEVVLSDGVSIPVKATLIFSNQLMEHLHPDDARDQLANVFAALEPGGKYFCITPNRISGPHDVSRGIDEVARGFHLREYTNRELAGLFRSVGFARVQGFARIRNFQTTLPLGVVTALETVVGWLPRPLGSRVSNLPILRRIIEIELIATRR